MTFCNQLSIAMNILPKLHFMFRTAITRVMKIHSIMCNMNKNFSSGGLGEVFLVSGVNRGGVFLVSGVDRGRVFLVNGLSYG